jgi:hypothetical protein
MRKLFIGCGVVVALLLAGLGYVTWRMYPAAKQFYEQYTLAIQELEKLDAEHPFDPQAQSRLDTVRFASMLEVRRSVTAEIQETNAALDRVRRENKVGLIGQMTQTLDAFSSVLPIYVERMRDIQTGPSEFSWHCRLLWTVLARVDAGAADPELDPLKNQYTRFKDTYDRMAREQKWQLLSERLGEFPPALVLEASHVIASDVGLVQAGLELPELDLYYLAPVNQLQDVQGHELRGLGQPTDGN